MASPKKSRASQCPETLADEQGRRRRDEIINELIVTRLHQIELKGYTEAHDDTHTEGELARAAAVYAALDLPGETPDGYIDWLMEMWPFTGHEPATKGHRANLIRAAAMIIAEIERLDRADKP